MRNFNSGDRSRSRGDSPRRSFGGGDSRRPILHDAVCDECGKDCQVPFRPSGDKPVYCSDCFEKKGGSDSNRPKGRRDSSRRSFGGGDSRRPSQSNISDRSTSQLIEKIEILNTKLETIINLLSSAGEKKSELAEDKTKKSKKST
ncbi:MAG TPA: CxxC-x17-CxxC domain-containing protein, partial [Desulfatiglandales bacterium]|nr:CxxC-x17-CxxC domain-containing protein [Desulfatiglandales bacterium]